MLITACMNFRKKLLKENLDKEADFPVFEHLSDVADVQNQHQALTTTKNVGIDNVITEVSSSHQRKKIQTKMTTRSNIYDLNMWHLMTKSGCS